MSGPYSRATLACFSWKPANTLDIFKTGTWPHTCKTLIAHKPTINGDFLRSADDTLSLSQIATADLCKVGTHTLALTHTAEVSLIRLAFNDLALTHQVDSNWILDRRRADTLALGHAAKASAVRETSAVGTLSLTHEATVVKINLVVDSCRGHPEPGPSGGLRPGLG